MANQDPQPELYSVVSDFDDLTGAGLGTVSGATVVTSVTTSQANNEEVRIYAMQVDMQASDNTALDPTTAANTDFSVTITVGPNNVPSQAIRLRPVWFGETKTLYFPTPILVLFQQPLQITVTTNQALATGSANGRIVTLNFISELAIQKVACAPSPTGYPRSPMGQ